MFCKQCGQQISGDSVFCPKCGTRQQSLHPTQSSTMNQTAASVLSTPSGELNREALKIYLHDVLALECIRRKYQFRMNTISKGLNMYSRDSFYKTYEFKGQDSWYAGSNYLHFLYKDGKHYLAVYRPYELDMCPVIRRDIDSPIRATLSYLDIEANSKKINSLGMNSIWLHSNNAGYGIPDKAKAAKNL